MAEIIKHYWWFCYSVEKIQGGHHFKELTSERHPFTVIHEFNSFGRYKTNCLMQFKEISFIEFELYRKLQEQPVNNKTKRA